MEDHDDRHVSDGSRRYERPVFQSVSEASLFGSRPGPFESRHPPADFAGGADPEPRPDFPEVPGHPLGPPPWAAWPFTPEMPAQTWGHAWGDPWSLSAGHWAAPGWDMTGVPPHVPPGYWPHDADPRLEYPPEYPGDRPHPARRPVRQEAGGAGPSDDEPPRMGGYRAPRFNLAVEEEAVRLHIELPGARPESLNVVLDPTRIVVSTDASPGQTGPDTPGLFYGEIELPEEVDVDAASSAYANGLLTLTLPRTGRGRRRTIRIDSG